MSIPVGNECDTGEGSTNTLRKVDAEEGVPILGVGCNSPPVDEEKKQPKMPAQVSASDKIK